MRQLETRIVTAFLAQIVIPVVVGSSPISHPKNTSAGNMTGASFFAASHLQL